MVPALQPQPAERPQDARAAPARPRPERDNSGHSESCPTNRGLREGGVCGPELPPTAFSPYRSPTRDGRRGSGTCCVGHPAVSAHTRPPVDLLRATGDLPPPPPVPQPSRQTPASAGPAPREGMGRRVFSRDWGSQGPFPSISPLGPAKLLPSRLLPELPVPPTAPPVPPACRFLVPSRVTARLHVVPEAVCPVTIIPQSVLQHTSERGVNLLKQNKIKLFGGGGVFPDEALEAWAKTLPRAESPNTPGPACHYVLRGRKLTSGPSWQFATEVPRIRVPRGHAGRRGSGDHTRGHAGSFAPRGRQGGRRKVEVSATHGTPRRTRASGATLPPHHPRLSALALGSCAQPPGRRGGTGRSSPQVAARRPLPGSRGPSWGRGKGRGPARLGLGGWPRKVGGRVPGVRASGRGCALLGPARLRGREPRAGSAREATAPQKPARRYRLLLPPSSLPPPAPPPPSPARLRPSPGRGLAARAGKAGGAGEGAGARICR